MGGFLVFHHHILSMGGYLVDLVVSTLQRQIEQIGLMPRSKQKFITEMLEALIKQQQAS